MSKDDNEHAYAQKLLGQRRYTEAIRIYEGRANAGDTHAQIFLGWMYFEGMGVRKDVQKAFSLFERAASLGSKEGAFYAGRAALLLGRYDKAFESFQAGARQEYGPALLWLGLVHIRGLGVPEDLDLGTAYLERAKNAGNRFAQREIALLMLRGRYGIAKVPIGLLLLPYAVIAGILTSLVKGPNEQVIG